MDINSNISKENKRMILGTFFQLIFCLFFIYAKYESKEEYILAIIIFICPFALDNIVGACTSDTAIGTFSYLIILGLFAALILPCFFYKLEYIPSIEHGVFGFYMSEGKINFFITILSMASKIVGSKL
ncbi:hypothetical protein [uncultured Fusobacterium sp.]|uniref:hypothetical protein n=1 Tax=uncultured Fusobacterium sp. TaxID=159267 RepID=UPI0025FE19F5|nr:hypothetical protein [uncultured Fusobacterium sp.]